MCVDCLVAFPPPVLVRLLHSPVSAAVPCAPRYVWKGCNSVTSMREYLALRRVPSLPRTIQHTLFTCREPTDPVDPGECVLGVGDGAPQTPILAQHRDAWLLLCAAGGGWRSLLPCRDTLACTHPALLAPRSLSVPLVLLACPVSLGFYASEAYVASLVERFNESQRACIDASLRNEGLFVSGVVAAPPPPYPCPCRAAVPPTCTYHF